MLRVNIELWPGGRESQKRDMGTLIIANDGSGDQEIGNYTYTISKWKNEGVWRRGGIKEFNRVKFGSWDLLFRVLRECLGLRNSDKTEYQILTDSTFDTEGATLEIQDRKLVVNVDNLVETAEFDLPEGFYLVRKL